MDYRTGDYVLIPGYYLLPDPSVVIGKVYSIDSLNKILYVEYTVKEKFYTTESQIKYVSKITIVEELNEI